MKKLYLVTGAAGHVGSVLIRQLLERGERVRALVYRGHSGGGSVGTEVCYGDITDASSLRPFFERTGADRVTLIHCAALITIASAEDPLVWKTNVEGTKNVMSLARDAGVERSVYVSSVHAIPERPAPEIITEVDHFSPDLVRGQYARSKAAAAQAVLDHARAGMDVSIVHPSGIIGPGDTELRNHMIRTIRAMADGRIPAAVEGGYDFVDSRDVARGILGCEERGRPGECYILSGHYATILELLNMVRRLVGKRPVSVTVPYSLARAAAAAAEKCALLLNGKPPLFTPYSVDTLHTNGAFSFEKAQKEFGYRPRPLIESVRASLS